MGKRPAKDDHLQMEMFPPGGVQTMTKAPQESPRTAAPAPVAAPQAAPVPKVQDAERSAAPAQESAEDRAVRAGLTVGEIEALDEAEMTGGLY